MYCSIYRSLYLTLTPYPWLDCADHCFGSDQKNLAIDALSFVAIIGIFSRAGTFAKVDKIHLR